jgi:hypothetical protein
MYPAVAKLLMGRHNGVHDCRFYPNLPFVGCRLNLREKLLPFRLLPSVLGVGLVAVSCGPRFGFG